MSRPVVRPATPDDLPRAIATLTNAFEHYAFTRHTIAADDHLRRLQRFNDLFLREIGLPHGKVWVANDGDAVAIWTTPESTGIGEAFTRLGPEFVTLAGDRVAQHQSAEATMQRHRPQEPVWFLGSIGVDPAHQGKGLGRAVIAPGLDAADEAGVLAFLETSDPGNVRFYEKLGFEITAGYTLPDDGPHTWSMMRPPRGGIR